MSSRTHSEAHKNSYYTAQNNARNTYNVARNGVITLLKQRKTYLDPKTYHHYLDKLTRLGSGLPSYITDEDTYTYWEWRGGFWGSFSYYTGYSYNINSSFYNQMAALTRSVTTYQTSIYNLTQANCENEYTMLPVSPSSDDCGLSEFTSSFRNSILPTKTISNDIVAGLKEGDPQYNTATTVDTTLNNYYSWNYQDTPNEYESLYANLSNYSIKNTYRLMGENTATLYNDCSNNDTLISISPENQLPYCISDKYAKAEETCKKVITLAGPDGFDYPKGYTQLTELWTNVSNAIPGNTAKAGNGILNSAQNSCDAWLDMFNAWQEAEAEAAASPCQPERAIQPTYDPVMLNMAQEWNKSASLYIESLMKRLEIIQKYIETYPNILQLEESGVTFGPSSLGGSMLLQYKVDQMTPGVAPVQYLTMLVPNGPDGDQGITGVPGLRGNPGSSDNSQGPPGPTGNPNLPTIFDR